MVQLLKIIFYICALQFFLGKNYEQFNRTAQTNSKQEMISFLQEDKNKTQDKQIVCVLSKKKRKKKKKKIQVNTKIKGHKILIREKVTLDKTRNLGTKSKS